MMRPVEIWKAYRSGSFNIKDVLSMAPLVTQAQQLEKDGKIEDAIEIWKRFYKSKYRKLQGGLNLLRLHRIGKLQIDPEPIIGQLKSDYPELVNPWIEAAKIHYQQEKYSIAFKEFKRAIEIRNDLASVLNLYISTAEALGKTKEVYPIIKKAFKENWKDERVFRAFLRMAVKVNDPQLKSDALDFFAAKPKEDLAELSAAIISLIKVTLENDLEIVKDGKVSPIDKISRPKLLTNPASCSKSWFESKFGQMLRDLQLRSQSIKRTQARKKILFVSYDNWNFMQAMMEALDQDSDVEVRSLELSSIRFAEDEKLEALIAKKLFARKSEKRQNSYWTRLFDWADVVYVEWANLAAAWVSWYLPEHKKIVVRLHSYEAFTVNPLLTNWGNVDILCSVSPHVLSFLNDLARLDEFQMEQKITPNLNSYNENPPAKETENLCSIGMIGFNNRNKNPKLALEVLNALKNKGLEPKLYLMGHPIPDEFENDQDQKYFDDFFSYIEDNQLNESLIYLPFNSDIDQGIKKFNFILSCSYREGTHESLIQAMLRGTIPVIRKWPFLSQYSSSENIYNKRWVFENAVEMTSFIIETLEAEKLSERQSEAKREAIEKFDSSKVLELYRNILLS